MGIQIVKAVQNMMNPFLDPIFWLITKLGEESVFLLIFIGIYTIYSQKFALRYSIVYLLSVGINSIVKMSFRRPRPYFASTDIANRLPASNYSFPSGHSQGYFVQATTAMLEINKQSKNKYLKIGLLVSFIVVGLLVMLSRLYWGQHYLSDVIVGMIFGLSLAMIFEWMFGLIPERIRVKFTLDLIYMIIMSLSFVVFVIFFVLELTKGIVVTKIYKFTSVFIAMALGNIFNSKKLKLIENQGWKKNIVKALILYFTILILFLIVYLFLEPRGYIIFIIYLIIGFICTIILPIIFAKLFGTRDEYDSKYK